MLWRATLAWQRAVRAALVPHGLTHVQFVLLASLWWLMSEGERPSQRQLAQVTGVDAMMASQVLRKLESSGLVVRANAPSDSRARELMLTPKGQDLLAGALQDVETADAGYFEVLGSDQAVFLDLLRRLMNQGDPSGSQPHPEVPAAPAASPGGRRPLPAPRPPGRPGLD